MHRVGVVSSVSSGFAFSLCVTYLDRPSFAANGLPRLVKNTVPSVVVSVVVSAWSRDREGGLTVNASPAPRRLVLNLAGEMYPDCPGYVNQIGDNYCDTGEHRFALLCCNIKHRYIYA